MTEVRILPNAATQNRQPDSRPPPNADSFRLHQSLVRISCYQSRHHQTSFFFLPHRTKGALVESNVADIGYYIRSRLTVATIILRVQVVEKIFGEYNCYPTSKLSQELLTPHFKASIRNNTTFEAVHTVLFLVINFNTIDFQSHAPFELLTVISENICFRLIVRTNNVLCNYRKEGGKHSRSDPPQNKFSVEIRRQNKYSASCRNASESYDTI